MKVYLVAFVVVIVCVNIFLLTKITQSGKALNIYENKIKQMTAFNESIQESLTYYYTSEIKIRDSATYNFIESQSSFKHCLVFRFLSYSCDNCIKEQLEIIKEEYERFLQAEIPVFLLVDDSSSIIKEYPILHEDHFTILVRKNINLDHLLNNESAFYFWCDSGEINHIFFPVPGIRQTTSSYFDFLKIKNDEEFILKN